MVKSKAIKVIGTLIKRLKAAHGIITELEGERKAFEMLLTPFKD